MPYHGYLGSQVGSFGEPGLHGGVEEKYLKAHSKVALQLVKALSGLRQHPVAIALFERPAEDFTMRVLPGCEIKLRRKALAAGVLDDTSVRARLDHQLREFGQGGYLRRMRDRITDVIVSKVVQVASPTRLTSISARHQTPTCSGRSRSR
jgi:hypothetical protein